MSQDREPPEPPRGLASLVGLWDDCDDFVDDVQRATAHRLPPRDLPDLDAGEPPGDADPAAKAD